MYERQRAVAWYTAQSECFVCSVSVVSVCPSCVRCVARGLTALALASTPSPGRDLGSPLVAHLGHTLSQPLCAQDQDPEPLALPGLSGNQGRVCRWCQFLPRGALGQRLPAVLRTDQCPKKRSTPSRAVFCLNRDLQGHKRNKFPPRLKTPMSPSSSRRMAAKTVSHNE